MIRWAFLFIFFLVSGLLILDGDTVFGQEPDSSFILADLSYEVYPTFSRIIIASNERIDFVSYELEDPYRIVIDLIGVCFCEFEEHVKFSEGLVKSADVIETPYAQRPKGLDEFFYAADYIIITPQSKMYYTISTAEGGKIVVVDISKEPLPQLRVSKVKPLAMPSEGAQIADLIEQPQPKEKEGLKVVAEPAEPTEIAEPAAQEAEKPTTVTEKPAIVPPIIGETIIEHISYEILDDASLVIIVSNKEIEFEVSRRYYPRFGIMLKPKKVVFTELEDEVRLDKGLVKSLQIIKDRTIKKPPTLDKYFYPIRYIVVEPAKKLPFDFYFNEDATISVVEISTSRPKEVIEVAKKEPEVKEVVPEEVTKEPEPEEERPVTRKEIIRELKEELKREGLLREEKLAEEKLAEEERRKKEAAHMAELFGKEAIKDLIVKGKGILSLAEAQEIAIKNSPTAKTAEEEMGLSRMKMREAFRALFPQVKLKSSHTKGDVLGVDFIEEVYGVQAEQPIFQGGRLLNTYKQSKVNLKLAGARHQKIKTDLDHKVAEAYYSTVTAIMNIRLQQDLLKEAEKILQIAQGRHKADLSTKLEILNVKTQHNQIQFQLASAERDLALARFKLQQAMNLDVGGEKMDLAEVNTELQFKILDVDLDKCLKLAFDNQPDILVNKLLVESNAYGEKTARGKDDFKIDVTGFYGRSGSHYETEPEKMDKDWNIGVKVSRPFGGNTASYSFTKEETSRKVGQTDRTGSTAQSGEFAILDGMSVASEIKEARVNRQKAVNDLIEARRQIALEVKEAYYSYQEAIIQVKNSLEKVKFQEEAVKVAGAQAELNEALQSQLLEAMIKLADERAIYIKALSDYNLSLSKLNKAVGLKDYFSID